MSSHTTRIIRTVCGLVAYRSSNPTQKIFPITGIDASSPTLDVTVQEFTHAHKYYQLIESSPTLFDVNCVGEICWTSIYPFVLVFRDFLFSAYSAGR